VDIPSLVGQAGEMAFSPIVAPKQCWQILFMEIAPFVNAFTLADC